ncbi:unnamed protein product [Moneuplotes crassus]|uniref:Uncharacterized protein n=1 Tax=Euplotes crassus TaxID=5936 RepID=A0AAD1ULI6_EUPCR|nr:unnamed protein product [Moneuplotes crassus]
MPKVIAPKIRKKKASIIKKTGIKDFKMPAIRNSSVENIVVSDPKSPGVKNTSVQFNIPTNLTPKNKQLALKHLNSFKLDPQDLNQIPEISFTRRRSFFRERSPSFISSRLSITKPKLDENEIKNMRMERIFKSIQDQTERGEQLKLTEIGLKGTPYHQLLIEEESQKHFVKKKDFEDILEIEKRFTQTIRNSKRDTMIYQKLAKDLSLDGLEESYKLPKSLVYDKESYINPKNTSHRYANSISMNLMNKVAKLNETNVQTHLKKLKFSNGLYQLSPVDSIKKFNNRPLNEIYNGKLQK